MERKNKIIKTVFTFITLILMLSTLSIAHSGNTDAKGGHKDNKNKSGLGSYHYHCGGNPPHLHTNGVCPYGGTSSSSSSSTATKTSTSSNNSSINVKSISISSSIEGKEINIGESITLNATISPSSATDKSIEWSSSDTKVAEVSKNGEVKAKGEGNVIITAKASNGVKADYELKIKVVEAESISFSKNDLKIEVGKTEILNVTILPETTTNKILNWNTSDGRIATVDKSGVVKGISEGEATITAEASNGVKAEIKVNITPIQITNLKIKDNSLFISEGSSKEIKLEVTPSNAKLKGITWESSDTSIVTVDENGVAHGLKQGKAIITAKASNGVSVSKEITIGINGAIFYVIFVIIIIITTFIIMKIRKRKKV